LASLDEQQLAQRRPVSEIWNDEAISAIVARRLGSTAR
jgi:hypothetical protein